MSGYVNTLVYFYLALVCLFRQKQYTSVFLSWNFYPSVFYPKGKNTLLERIHCYMYEHLLRDLKPELVKHYKHYRSGMNQADNVNNYKMYPNIFRKLPRAEAIIYDIAASLKLSL